MTTENEAMRLLNRADPARVDDSAPFARRRRLPRRPAHEEYDRDTHRPRNDPDRTPDGRQRWPIIAVAARPSGPSASAGSCIVIRDVILPAMTPPDQPTTVALPATAVAEESRSDATAARGGHRVHRSRPRGPPRDTEEQTVGSGVRSVPMTIRRARGTTYQPKSDLGGRSAPGRHLVQRPGTQTNTTFPGNEAELRTSSRSATASRTTRAPGKDRACCSSSGYSSHSADEAEALPGRHGNFGPIVMVGEGAYEGLTAIIGFDSVSGTTCSVRGYIFDGSVPAPPAPLNRSSSGRHVARAVPGQANVPPRMPGSGAGPRPDATHRTLGARLSDIAEYTGDLWGIRGRFGGGRERAGMNPFPCLVVTGLTRRRGGTGRSHDRSPSVVGVRLLRLSDRPWRHVGGVEPRAARLADAQVRPLWTPQSVHTQSRISGWSSKCSRAYAVASAIRASHSASSAGARSRRRGTRRIASAARWKRLISFITTIWNGVVVVPCSLKPRTWMRSTSGCPCTISWIARWYPWKAKTTGLSAVKSSTNCASVVPCG